VVFGGFDLTSSAGADSGQVGVEAESSMSNVEHSGPGREKIDANIEASDAFVQEEPPTPSIRALLVQCRYLIPKPAAEDEESDWSDTEVKLLDLKKAGLYGEIPLLSVRWFGGSVVRYGWDEAARYRANTVPSSFIAMA
jgi:hypothetical protein